MSFVGQGRRFIIVWQWVIFGLQSSRQFPLVSGRLAHMEGIAKLRISVSGRCILVVCEMTLGCFRRIDEGV